MSKIAMFNFLGISAEGLIGAPMGSDMYIKWPFNILKTNGTRFWKSRGFKNDIVKTRTWNQTPVYWDRM